jgi:PIN domain nuclease of toxin-antitoxin system
MYFLDTNAVIWLYQCELDKFSLELKQILEMNDLFISPLVKLELQYLFEIKRIRERAAKVIEVLYETIGLQLHNVPLTVLIERCLGELWTRDPFDRMITAHARLEDAYLITRDETIRSNYAKAIW